MQGIKSGRQREESMRQREESMRQREESMRRRRECFLMVGVGGAGAVSRALSLIMGRDL